MTLAAAVAGRTKRIQINIAAILVPLHDPLRLAEQLATVALVSGGRLGFVAGLGYRQEEFDMAAVDRKQRGRLLEEYVGVMRQAWSGEPFEWRGRTVRVTPKPPAEPMLLIGGSTEKAAKRAAKLRAGFFPAIGDAKLADIYNAECQRLGFHGGFVSMPNGPGFVHVSKDPERDWQRVGPHALYDAQTYAAWQTPDQRSQMHVEAETIDDMKRSAAYQILTPDQCVKLAEETGRIILHPLMGGWPPVGMGELAPVRARSVAADQELIGGGEVLMPDLAELERRIHALEDIEAIKQLKYRYWRHLDLKQWDELARCFAADATVCYSSGKYEFRGVDAIMSFLSESLGEARGSVTIHHGHHPEIELLGPTSAPYLGALQLHVQHQAEPRHPHRRLLRRHLRKLDGAWKFTHIGYRTLFHEEWKRDDIPSLPASDARAVWVAPASCRQRAARGLEQVLALRPRGPGPPPLRGWKESSYAGSMRAGTCLCHGVPASQSRCSDAVSSFGGTPCMAMSPTGSG